MKDGNAVADVLDVGEQVRAHDHCLAPRLQVDDQVLHLPGADRVEAAGGFVEDHEFGVVDQRLGNADPASHALGILAELPLAVSCETDHLDQGRRAPPPLLRIEAEEPAIEIERLLGIEEFVEIRLLGEVADSFVLRDVGGGSAEDQRLTRRGKDQAKKQFERRRLSRTVGAEQTEDLASPHVEVERLERGLLAAAPEISIDLRQVAGLDDDIGRVASGFRSGCRRGHLIHGLVPSKKAFTDDRTACGRILSVVSHRSAMWSGWPECPATCGRGVTH